MVTIIVCAILALVLADQLNALSKDCIGVGGGGGSGSFDGGSLNFDLYISSCPQAEAIIFSGVQRAIASDPRMAASLLRLHFHDCFVNGCDASVLLDDTPNLVGEKTAGPNLNSLRGFDVVDGIKTELEMACPETVSCADVLAIAARDSVVLLAKVTISLHSVLQSGGPTWQVEVGRRDGVTAILSMATANIPAPTSDVATLVQKFQNLGLSTKDMVVLSGTRPPPTSTAFVSHSPTYDLEAVNVQARCSSFVSRLNGGGIADAAADRIFLQSLQQLCAGSNGTLAHLDLATPATFDNQYYVNLLSGEGLLPSDQVLVNGGGEVGSLVQAYAMDPVLFYEDFAVSMVRMGRLAPPSGSEAEVRRCCRVINSTSQSGMNIFGQLVSLIERAVELIRP
ncbi:peroxidase [Musa troglodytarum]|uniref:Peroxidase n=1 Tax=Musa troglodytarum TaxID=320322 RepID=A0A9E7FRL4_9LILI|nr:peroxidase [Musa troglodytarum]